MKYYDRKVRRAIRTAARSFLSFFVPLLLLSACNTVNDDRVPVQPVNIVFRTVADWNVYGVAGALEHRSFIRDKRQPANFPYTEMTYTGFGGVLLVSDVMGTPMAYDLSCPVERRRNVRVFINDEAEHLAECPECGSRYNVFSLMGYPVSGEAADHGYALRRYRVTQGAEGQDYRTVRF